MSKKLDLSAPMGRRQQGVVLFIALIVLVAMTLAGLAIMRSVDTGNLVSGNVAFRQAALSSGDRGIDTAFTWLKSNVTTGVLNNNSVRRWLLRHGVQPHGLDCRFGLDQQESGRHRREWQHRVLRRLAPVRESGSPTTGPARRAAR